MATGHERQEGCLPMANSTIKIIIDDKADDNDSVSEAAKNTTNNNVTPPTRSISTLASFLVGIHPGYFTITNSMTGQALLWKILSQNSVSPNRGIPWIAFPLLWWLAFSCLFLLTFLYSLRCIMHFKILKQEFSNPVLLNYLFAPWISWMLLLQSVPLQAPFVILYQDYLWGFLVIPVIFLDLKLYGQWFTTEKRFLSMFANPTTQMSITANMVAAWTASRMGWKETAVCIFSVGAVHYFVVFVTLYQRFAGAANFPALLRPVFLMFVAAPCAACLAWSSILGTFSISCKLLFFLSLFLFVSLACRPALFKKSMKRYNVGWWAYSFPLTLLALASSEYGRNLQQEGGGVAAPGMTLLLSAISVVVFLGLMVSTALNAQSILVQESDPFLSLTSCFPKT